MSEYTTIHDGPDHDARSFRDLPPSVRTIVSDSLPTRDRCLSVTLCTLAGEVARSVDGDGVGARIDRTIAPVSEAVYSFDGYVRIRFDLLSGEQYERADARDAAILASDYLHAAAYATIAETPVSDRRSLELYRTLVSGSTALAAQFLSRAPEAGTPNATRPQVSATDRWDASSHPDVTLAETAAALGTTAVGATAETRSAVERYAGSLATTLSAKPSARDDVRAIAIRALSVAGDQPRVADDRRNGEEHRRSDEGHRRSGEGEPTASTHHLETAREAIETLRRRGGTTDRHEGHDPIDRLERATRIPFERVADTDG
ncbi:hypothetical protein AB7C87_06090 [Natrarchaeobius sp. A-rgal3]|uniref:hypothetical protein n=1 Tax=Natrarchaeobius versutus TaxID=1679078 RepID=UPI00351008B3